MCQSANPETPVRSVAVPTYEYRCTECSAPLEVVQSFTDAPLTECPECGGRLRKLFSKVGVVFKGSGFYKTDSRSASGGRPKSEVSAESKTEATATADKTDTKTDAKAGAADASTAKPEPKAGTSKPAKSKGSESPAA
jgi:putative FmdB family regulatory protein